MTGHNLCGLSLKYVVFLSSGKPHLLEQAINVATILILDESTGALDPVSEAEVLDKLLYYRQGKTTIMISHRPKVIQRADWIVMLESGRLKIQGSPSVLRFQAGEHLDFLDAIVPTDTTNSLVFNSNHSNGKSSAN